MSERIAYHTDLPLRECTARLRQTRAEHPWSIRRIWSPLPEGTVESTVWGRRFFLSAWPPLYTRNSFGPVFYGLLTERPDGTWLTGRFLLYPVVIGFLIVWFGGASFGLGLAVYFAIAESGGLEAWAPRTLAPVGGAAGVLLFGYVLVRFGIRSARSQRASIERYLESVLGARRRAPTGGGGPV